MKIHPTAVIYDGAQIGEGCEIGPYSIIGSKVTLGKNNRISSHVVIDGNTEIGDENIIFQFASVGSAPQDLKFHGEDSVLKIGDKNIIREYATIQPGTEGGGMITSVGSRNLFMVSSHIGHDCKVGDGNVFSNSVALAGHVTVGNNVILGGLSAVHQFVRLGDLCFAAGGAMVDRDVPPYCFAFGNRAKLSGINKVGLERKGFSHEERLKIFGAYKIYTDTGLTLEEKAKKISTEYKGIKAVEYFIDFIVSSERGIVPLRD